MNLSRKISPKWVVAVGIGVAGGLTALYMSASDIPEPIKPVKREASTAGPMWGYLSQQPAENLEDSKKENVIVVPSQPVKEWEARFHPDTDDECNGIRDYAIGSIRRTTSDLQNGRAINIGQDFALKAWAGAYHDAQTMRGKHGEAMKGCVHPDFYGPAQLTIEKGKIIQFLLHQYSVANDQSASLYDRYRAWEKMNKLAFSASIISEPHAVFTTDEMLSSIGHTRDSFSVMGKQIGGPILHEIVAEINQELANVTGQISEEKMKDFQRRLTFAYEVSSSTGIHDIHIQNLREIIQKIPYAAPTAQNGPR